MMRFYASRICIIGDYKKNDGNIVIILRAVHQMLGTKPIRFADSDLLLAFWFADEEISCLFLRLVGC
jgi:hypothetical protein